MHMRVVFYYNNPLKFSGNEIKLRPIGGAETCVINLARELAKNGTEVIVLNNCDSGVYDNVNYVHISNADSVLKNKTTDVLVHVRAPPLVDFRKMYNIKLSLLWSHDQAVSNAFHNINTDYFDYIVALSEWHRNDISTVRSISRNKIIVIGNGYDPELFYKQCPESVQSCDKQRVIRMIYSSTPYRGLNNMVQAFKIIKQSVSNVHLNVCSSMKVYDYRIKDIEYEQLYNICRLDGNITYYGSVKQQELGNIMRQSTIMTYPSVFNETYCISTLEAVACGLGVITVKRAALAETIPAGCAVYAISSKPETFAKKVVDVITNNNKLDRLIDNAKNADLTQYTWSARAKQWIDAISKLV